MCPGADGKERGITQDVEAAASPTAGSILATLKLAKLVRIRNTNKMRPHRDKASEQNAEQETT
jgi:hypothetical protein